MQLSDGKSRVQVLAEAETKNFVDVRKLLTTSVSIGLSKDSSSIHLIYTIQSQEQYNNTPYKLDLGPFPPDVACSFPPE